MLKKNDIITAEITDNGAGGEGIAKSDGYTLFVKNGVKGDRAEIKILKINKKMYDLCKLKETKEMVCKLNPGEKHKKCKETIYIH